MNPTEQRNHKTALRELESSVEAILIEFKKNIQQALREANADLGRVENLIDREAFTRGRSINLLHDRLTALDSEMEIRWRATNFAQGNIIQLFAVPVFAGFWGRLRWLLLGKRLSPTSPSATSGTPLSDPSQLDPITASSAPERD